jgi:hypothetical protein
LALNKHYSFAHSDDDIAYIYRAIPDYRKITNHWDLISDPFFNQLLKTSFLYTENNGGNWVGPEEAVFQIFQESVTKGKEDQICCRPFDTSPILTQ